MDAGQSGSPPFLKTLFCTKVTRDTYSLHVHTGSNGLVYTLQVHSAGCESIHHARPYCAIGALLLALCAPPKMNLLLFDPHVTQWSVLPLILLVLLFASPELLLAPRSVTE